MAVLVKIDRDGNMIRVGILRLDYDDEPVQLKPSQRRRRRRRLLAPPERVEEKGKVPDEPEQPHTP